MQAQEPARLIARMVKHHKRARVEDQILAGIMSKRARATEDDADEVSTGEVDRSSKLNLKFILQELTSCENPPAHLYPLQFLGAVVNIAEEFTPENWRNLFDESTLLRSSSKLWIAFYNRYKANCEKYLKDHDKLVSSTLGGKTFRSDDMLKRNWFRRQIECVQKAFGSNGEQNPDFIEVVCGLLVKLYDVRRDGKDKMPSRKRREKELGSLIVEKYRRLKSRGRGMWEKKICLQEELLENFPKAGKDTEAEEHLDAATNFYQTDEEADDEDVPNYASLPTSRTNLNITTDEKLEHAKKDLARERQQLAALQAQIHAKHVDVAKAEKEVEVLKARKKIEAENERIVASVRQIVPATSADDALDEFAELIDVFKYLKQKSANTKLSDAFASILRQEFLQEYKTTKNKDGNQSEENESDSDDSAEEPVALSYAERYRQPVMQDGSLSKEPTGPTTVSQAVADLQRVEIGSEREGTWENVDDVRSHSVAPSSIGNESEAVDALAALAKDMETFKENNF